MSSVEEGSSDNVSLSATTGGGGAETSSRVSQPASAAKASSRPEGPVSGRPVPEELRLRKRKDCNLRLRQPYINTDGCGSISFRPTLFNRGVSCSASCCS